MKKTLSVLGIFILCTGVSATSFASSNNNGKGGTLTVDGGTVAGTPDLVFESSPNVSIAIETSATAYAVMTTNVLTNQDNGMEFGSLSTDTGYSQRVKTIAEDTAITGPTDEATLEGTGWIAVGTAATGGS